MIRLRLGFALTILAACAGNVQSAPLNAPQAEVVGHLAAAFATHDPIRVTYAYRAMGDSGLPAADIVESMINAMGYELLENGEIDAAMKVFNLNVETFPLSANTWDSLAEAAMTKGDHETAIRCYRVSVSLKLDPKSKNAVQQISYANRNDI
jgi:tetratricopeptide (TPR) repeat protein